jgi:hypothetical protein
MIQIIIMIVGPIKENPPKPKTKSTPGLSNKPAVDRNDTTKRGIAQRRKL